MTGDLRKTVLETLLGLSEDEQILTQVWRECTYCSSPSEQGPQKPHQADLLSFFGAPVRVTQALAPASQGQLEPFPALTKPGTFPTMPGCVLSVSDDIILE